MAKIRTINLFHFGLIILVSPGTYGQNVAYKATRPPKPVAAAFASEDAMREAVFTTASKYVGMYEGGRDNDAAWIANINSFNYLPTRSRYCASAFYYVHAVNGVLLPVNGVGMVRSYFRDSRRIIFSRNARGNTRKAKPQLMDAVSMFGSHVEGIAQRGYDPNEDDTVLCIGFNTSSGKKSREGCFINRRRTREIKMIANWITPYWEANFKKS